MSRLFGKLYARLGTISLPSRRNLTSETGEIDPTFCLAKRIGNLNSLSHRTTTRTEEKCGRSFARGTLVSKENGQAPLVGRHFAACVTVSAK